MSPTVSNLPVVITILGLNIYNPSKLNIDSFLLRMNLKRVVGGFIRQTFPELPQTECTVAFEIVDEVVSTPQNPAPVTILISGHFPKEDNRLTDLSELAISITEKALPEYFSSNNASYSVYQMLEQ